MELFIAKDEIFAAIVVVDVTGLSKKKRHAKYASTAAHDVAK